MKVLDSIGEAANVAWVDDDTLVVERRSPDNPYAFSLWSITADGGDLARLTAIEASGCRDISYRFPQRLPDGRIGAVRDCSGELPIDQSRTYVALDPATGAETELAPLNEVGAQPSSDGRPPPDLNPTTTTWTPDLSSAVAVIGNSNCVSLASLDDSGVGPLDLTLPDGTRVDEYLRMPPGGPCTDDIRAAGAAYAPDGDRLAFAASPDSWGVCRARPNR